MSFQTTFKNLTIFFEIFLFFILKNLFYAFLIFESILIIRQTNKILYFNLFLKTDRVYLLQKIILKVLIFILGNNILSQCSGNRL